MVLHRRHRVLLSPVGAVGQSLNGLHLEGTFSIERGSSKTGGVPLKAVETGTELGIGHVGKVVHPHGEGFPAGQVLSVVLQNELKVACKNALSVGFLFSVVVVSAILSLGINKKM